MQYSQMRQNLKQTQTLHMKDIQSVHYDTRMEILAGNFKLSFAEVEFPVSGHTDTRMLGASQEFRSP